MKTHGMSERHAREISDSLDSFSQNAGVFSSAKPRLIDLYKDKWVGVYHGEVAAAEDTLESVAHSLTEKGIPLGDAMIRKVDQEEKTFIL